MMLRPVVFVMVGMLFGMELANLLFRLVDGEAELLDWLTPLLGLVMIVYFFWSYWSEGWHRGD